MSNFITTVLSSYGHRFMDNGNYDSLGQAYVNCLTCGAEYLERNLGGGRGEYVANFGQTPDDCTRNTDLQHGIEQSCDIDRGRPCLQFDSAGSCQHTDFQCNCLQCDA